MDFGGGGGGSGQAWPIAGSLDYEDMENLQQSLNAVVLQLLQNQVHCEAF